MNVQYHRQVLLSSFYLNGHIEESILSKNKQLDPASSLDSSPSRPPDHRGLGRVGQDPGNEIEPRSTL